MDGAAGTDGLSPSRPGWAKLPALEWLRGYDRAQFADDALAALIVTIMLIPQSLAYALLAGVPPRDAGAGAGALQAFQQVGGAVGVALTGEIFFSNLGSIPALFQAGPAAVHAAFASSTATAVWFQIATFAAVLVLVFFLKARGPQQQGQGGAPAHAAPPMPAEA